MTTKENPHKNELKGKTRCICGPLPAPRDLSQRAERKELELLAARALALAARALALEARALALAARALALAARAPALAARALAVEAVLRPLRSFKG